MLSGHNKYLLRLRDDPGRNRQKHRLIRRVLERNSQPTQPSPNPCFQCRVVGKHFRIVESRPGHGPPPVLRAPPPVLREGPSVTCRRARLEPRHVCRYGVRGDGYPTPSRIFRSYTVVCEEALTPVREARRLRKVPFNVGKVASKGKSF